MTDKVTQRTEKKFIENCRGTARREQLYREYAITPAARFNAPGFKTCCQAGHELEGTVMILDAKCRSDGSEYRIVCGSGGAKHFRELLLRDGITAWPELINPYADYDDKDQSSTNERDAELRDSLTTGAPSWVRALCLICVILLTRLRATSGPLMSIFTDLVGGHYKYNQAAGVNTIAQSLLSKWGLLDIDALITHLETAQGRRFKRPDFTALEAVRTEHLLHYTKPWVLR